VGGRARTDTDLVAGGPPGLRRPLRRGVVRVALIADRGRECGDASGKLLFSAAWEDVPGGIRLRDVQPGDAFSRVLWAGAAWRRIG
jgi:hypothetical protein